MSDSVYANRALNMVLTKRGHQRRDWSFEHDLLHTEEEWEGLILKFALEHRWTDVGALALAAQEMRIAAPVEAMARALAEEDSHER
ncbi:hypothetical protein LCGC14_0391190 [marine sediment metagenome]|uniref:Uncharacterized protein n=1 Tax=marine sediment metagenome TaxID=412755 RepID=A0A0F9W8F0_9ZZZZ